MFAVHQSKLPFTVSLEDPRISMPELAAEDPRISTVELEIKRIRPVWKPNLES